MNSFDLIFIALLSTSILFLSSCTNQATQSSTGQTNAAVAPTPVPYNPRPMPMVGRY
jgi:hypothetical protein